MNKVVLLLGSNMGERLIQLEIASNHISREIGMVTGQSSVYETDPWGNHEQERYLNQVILVSSQLAASSMMQRIILLEEEMGRKRMVKWEARIIDIDILFFNDEIISAGNVIIPHPGLHLRKFTLIPLVEIIPHRVHPVFKKTVSDLLHELNDPLEVIKQPSTVA